MTPKWSKFKAWCGIYFFLLVFWDRYILCVGQRPEISQHGTLISLFIMAATSFSFLLALPTPLSLQGYCTDEPSPFIRPVEKNILLLFFSTSGACIRESRIIFSAREREEMLDEEKEEEAFHSVEAIALPPGVCTTMISRNEWERTFFFKAFLSSILLSHIRFYS